jgi:thymidylate synthase (FAD)
MKNLINDPFFKVVIDLNGSSPAPAKAIWTAQHVCVTDHFAPDDPIPSEPAQAIIDNQLKPKHWSVLKFAFVVLHFKGFPHDTVMQLVRHQDSAPLVQSFRYTGADRMNRCGQGLIDPYEMFYVPPVGKHSSRSGISEFTLEKQNRYLQTYLYSAQRYAEALADGDDEETARGLLASRYRQNFTMAGTIEAVFHWLDQRTLADSQVEAQTLAWMALDELEKWEPTLFGWYRENRAGKNLLAP